MKVASRAIGSVLALVVGFSLAAPAGTTTCSEALVPVPVALLDEPDFMFALLEADRASLTSRRFSLNRVGSLDIAEGAKLLLS